MKKKFFGILTLALLLAGVSVWASGEASAGGEGSQAGAAQSSSGNPPATPVVSDISEEEIRQGLWRDGDAWDFDVPLFDLFLPTRYVQGYRPEQPVKYSHVLHVQKLGIECQYCHSGVQKSSYATIPALEVCMGCHKLDVAKKDSPEIKKLRDAWDAQKPIEWVPVHNIPEHVQFNHQRHVKAGVGCQNCHGQVQKMEVVERVSTMKMGFCVSCHREQGASIDCGVCHY